MDNRQRIIEEAALMYRTYGIRAVTMDMLANQMAISKRTIYELFSDKDELLIAVIKWMENKQREVLVKIMNESGNIIEAIFKMLDLMSNHLKNVSPAFLLDIRKKHKMMIDLDEKKEMHFFGFNEEVVKKGIEQGIFREDIDVKISNICLFEVGKMSNGLDLKDDDDFVRNDVMRNLYINYLRGISTQKGLELISYYEKQANNNK
jgi:TetR/AcrR family transcriptional regulator, cholesterol catabolism regulator